MRKRLAIAALGAHVVLAWSVRDALFLSQFDVARLPLVLLTAAAIAFLLAPLVARAVAARGPQSVLVTSLLGASAVNFLLWWAARLDLRATAFTLYVLVDVTASILFAVQGALVTERYGARGAQSWRRSQVVWMLGGAVLGAVLTDRIGAGGDVLNGLPLIAVLEAVAGLSLARLNMPDAAVPAARPILTEPRRDTGPITVTPSLLVAPRTVAGTPYLRALVATLVLAATCSVPLDYVLKQNVASHFVSAGDKLQFFARYHAVATLLAFGLQPVLGRILLQRVGLGAALASLPLAIVLGSLPVVALPGLLTAALGRGIEFVVRRSGFRPAYVVLYTPVPARIRNAASALVDVCGERLGEGAGGLLLLLILMVTRTPNARWLGILAAGLAGLTLLATRRLQAAYVRALEDGLRRHAVEESEADSLQDRTTRALLQSRREAELPGTWQDTSLAIPVDELRRALREMRVQQAAGSESSDREADTTRLFSKEETKPVDRKPDAGVDRAAERSIDRTARLRVERGADRTADRLALRRSLDEEAARSTPRPAAPASAAATSRTPLPVAADRGSGTGWSPALSAPDSSEVAPAVADLRSENEARIRQVLRQPGALDRALLPHVVPLLAQDLYAADTVEALRRSVSQVTGYLVDVLLDPQEFFAVRRRLPRILAHSNAPRSIDGLMRGLQDPRFEVRVQCGRALARLHVAHPEVVFERDQVMALVLQEARRGKRVWEGQQLLDRSDDADESPLVDEVLRDRANRSLEHVFALLSLVLPLAPLRSAFAGLHGDDETLRGTALEYLESVLPPDVRGSLWPLLQERGDTPRSTDPGRQSLSDLVSSNQSIQINLEELRRRLREES